MKGDKDSFICGVPCSKITNSETVHVTGFALCFEEGFEVMVFNFFTGNSFLHGFGTILKGATDADDGNMVAFLNDDIRSDW